MSTAVQRRRGTTAQHATFAGLNGELTVDTDKEVVVVHDGVVAGGYPQMRENGSNSALALGSAATPALKFTGDTDTGIYSPGANQLAISTNGTGRLFVDASGRVGVGVTAPQADLQVGSGTITPGEFTGASIQHLYNPGLMIGAPASTGLAGRINFATDGGIKGRILYDYASNFLRFDTNGAERVRVTAGGQVGIGTSAPPVALDVVGGIRGQALDATGSPALYSAAGGGVLYHTGSGTAVLRAYSNVSGSAGNLTFNASGSENARIDSSGRLLVGTSSSRTIGGALAGTIQIESAGVYATSTIISNTNTGGGSYLALGKTRSNSTGGVTAVQANDDLGGITFNGADGSAFISAAYILGQADGTPGANDMPGRLVFSTTADGAASPTERLRITNDGVRGYNQSAPAAVDATATLTVANLKTGIITSTTAAAVTMTLPTGTLTEGGFSGLYNNFTFKWTVINTGGTNAVTVQGDTDHTLVGSGTVAAGVSGRFASRRTAANTFVSYRLS